MTLPGVSASLMFLYHGVSKNGDQDVIQGYFVTWEWLHVKGIYEGCRSESRRICRCLF